MPQRTAYPQGTPNWAELRTTDPAGAASFYGPLFGWRFEPTQRPDRLLAVLGADVAAVIRVGSEAAGAVGSEPAWNVYLAVDDVDAVTRAVPDAGGTVLAGPTDTDPAVGSTHADPAAGSTGAGSDGSRQTDAGQAGRSAVVRDPGGAIVGLWQAGREAGAGVVGEPGAVAWHELLTGDLDAAVAFYQRILGLTPEPVEPDPALGGMRWSMLKAGHEPVAGVVPVPGAPSRWNVYFATADIHDAVRRVAELGGTVALAPTETPIGPMAGALDPQGARFSLWTPRVPT
ncbi:VOC family protein [Longispora sp. K20-0274]|uniref:VOC family protein n=1 Tax=Longispora sp. K20-0274 TaxID=3088255 RepID=UPI00399A0073